MFKDQCISVTDLRTRTKECLDTLTKKPKFIFINNSPVAVLLGIQEYEEQFSKPELIELPKKNVTVALKAMALTAKKSKKKDLVNV